MMSEYFQIPSEEAESIFCNLVKRTFGSSFLGDKAGSTGVESAFTVSGV
jgi:hypothetical protein